MLRLFMMILSQAELVLTVMQQYGWIGLEIRITYTSLMLHYLASTSTIIMPGIGEAGWISESQPSTPRSPCHSQCLAVSKFQRFLLGVPPNGCLTFNTS
ncbi:hypothetical protein DER46DRAFT_37954 [Fusarium sp. MPI-SDFR-AT-0072]|nr:hypothetical protein DER46DRAFT_37954 [Fusarium sp. MPI-SDFR-AT-0072]